MRNVRLIAVACAIGAAPTTAISQTSDYSFKDTRILMADYAKCVVAHHPAQASEALLRNVDNTAILRDYKSLIDGRCLVEKTHTSAKMSFAGDLYRYALADALVAREFSNVAAQDMSNVPRLVNRPLPVPPPALTPASSKAERRHYAEALRKYDEARGFQVLAAFGECVARLNPVNARALILTKPTSRDEDSQFNLLKPTLAQCLPEGATVEFGKIALRGTIAVNYYRLAHAAGR
jgi:hypothetical protein